MRRAPLAPVASVSEWDELASASDWLLVTFTSPRCMICKQLAPMLNVVAAEAGDALASAKIDAEALPELAERFDVRSLPTTLLLREGSLADRISGFATAGALRTWLKERGVRFAGNTL